MKLSRFFSGFFLTAAIALMCLALVLVMGQPGAKPTLMTTAQDAQDRVSAAMDAICQGDFTAAEPYLLGQPKLGVDRAPTEPAAALIWDAFLDSLSYQLNGSCYATDTGVAQDITLTYLNIPSVTANLAQRSESHLEKLQQEATHTYELYDENGDFLQEVVLQVLQTAVAEALQEDAQHITTTFTLQLVYRDGLWYVVANSDFITAISGGI